MFESANIMEIMGESSSYKNIRVVESAPFSNFLKYIRLQVPII
jgi:hypothetical protein